ncbi:flagellar hook-associated protein FlgL [Aliikangiella sp. G2MR2-5]|uniref:flagellar hook-associated protein FlgL n=1 Tax=Aliikangiella sp. G2MR2-5 TaxID=2788943 RepID=UPI0018A93062|nr:flagellar hook-associated protein FlgL [Aliikangiella sp. G2MR2-5]
MRLSTYQMTSAGVRQILLRQADLQYTQLQLSSQKRVLTPSDDPVAATSISFLKTEIEQLEQFNVNAQMSKSGNELEEDVLSSITDILFRVKELMVSVGNGIYGENELKALGAEMQERLNELVGLANTKNSNGDYLFSGSKVKAKPFIQDNAGNFIYDGDQTQRKLRISSGVVVPVSDSGFEVFVDVKNGNGKFITGADVANTGTGVIVPGSYTAPPQFLVEPYDISFAIGGGGALEYTVTGRTSGTIFAGPATFQSGADISFNGIQTVINGTPAAGDVFTVDPSSSQDLFTGLQNVINAIDNFVDVPSQRAIFNSTIAAQEASINMNMQNIDRIRGSLGSRLVAIDTEMNSNLTLLVTSKSALSDVQDLDVVEASSRFSQQLTTLEAAQATFVRVRDLNLFNFL